MRSPDFSFPFPNGIPISHPKKSTRIILRSSQEIELYKQWPCARPYLQSISLVQLALCKGPTAGVEVRRVDIRWTML